jgi:hypothetical protein
LGYLDSWLSQLIGIFDSEDKSIPCITTILN